MTKPIHTLLLVFGLLIVFSIVNVYLINDSRVSFRKETEKLSNLLHVQTVEAKESKNIEIEYLKQEIQKLTEKIEKLENLQKNKIPSLPSGNSLEKKTISIPLRESDEWWRVKRTKDSHDYLLVIAIPTVARIGNDGKPKDYLLQVCNKLLEEINKYFEFEKDSKHKILVLVQSVDPQKEHVYFDKLSNMEKFKNYFVFDKLEKRKLDPFDDIPGHDYTAPQNTIPGKRARQQSWDVLNLVEVINSKYPSDYIMFMEDDFLACSNSIIESIRSIGALELRRKDVCSFSLSYGMNGIIMSKENSMKFVKHSEKNILKQPIDHLYHSFALNPPKTKEEQELLCFPNKRLYTHKLILFEHIGSVSTFKERNVAGFRSTFKKCGDQSGSFNAICAGNPESISPC